MIFESWTRISGTSSKKILHKLFVYGVRVFTLHSGSETGPSIVTYLSQQGVGCSQELRNGRLNNWLVLFIKRLHLICYWLGILLETGKEVVE